MPSVTRVHSHESQVFIDNTLIKGVQSFNYSNPKNFEVIRKLGSYKEEDYILTADQPITSTINFIVNDHVLSRTSNYLKFLSSDESTLKLKDSTSTTTFANSSITDYSLNFSIGNLAEGSYSYESNSISVASIPYFTSSDENNDAIKVFTPQKMTLTTNFDEGINSTDYPIQNVDLNISISREAVIRVGDRTAKRRYPTLPSQGTLDFSVIKNNITDTVDLSNLVTEKGNFIFAIEETALGSASANPTLNIKVYNCFLESVNHSHDLDGNAQLDFSYSFPIANDAIEYYFS